MIIKKSKKLFALNKQKVASLDKQLSAKLKGRSCGGNQITGDGTAQSLCIVCEDTYL